MFGKITNIHFIGIGGIGMSGIAEMLHKKGFKISGSDMYESDVTRRLGSLGIKIMIGHSPENVSGSDLVVYTSAVDSSNPELKEALERNMISIKRSEMLAEVMRDYYGICISGTHGKTTTSAMISKILLDAEYDPAILIGGNVKFLNNGNSRNGDGEYIVVESDEFDRSFLRLSPSIAVITNIEEEHLDIYKDIDDLKDAFTQFANKLPFYGFTVACADDLNIQSIIPNLKRKVITYGISEGDLQAADIIQNENRSEFVVEYKNTSLGKFKLNIPGSHNIKNSLAAITVATELGIDTIQIKNSLAEFYGVQRRFEIKYDKEIIVVDDYAHHPGEVRETLSGIKSGWKRRIIAVFQPHLYTRTKQFYKEFAEAFMLADVFVCAEIYPAREKPIEGITSKLIIDEIEKLGHNNFHYAHDKEEIPILLKKLVKKNDLVITMGAGDVYKYGERFIQELISAD